MSMTIWVQRVQRSEFRSEYCLHTQLVTLLRHQGSALPNSLLPRSEWSAGVRLRNFPFVSIRRAGRLGGLALYVFTPHTFCRQQLGIHEMRDPEIAKCIPKSCCGLVDLSS